MALIGIGADGGLAGQHHRVHAVADRVGRVADLGARRARLPDHRLEDLRRDDDRHAERAGAPRDGFLHPRHGLERQLEPEVAPRHHHRLAGVQDVVERRDRLRALELGHERQIGRAGLAQRRPRLTQIVGAQHEAHGHEVHARPDAERQILPCPSP